MVERRVLCRQITSAIRRTPTAITPAADPPPQYAVTTPAHAGVVAWLRHRHPDHSLADWLRRPQARLPHRLWIATDPEHTARATLLARIALAGRGIQIQPDHPPPSSPGERSKLLRDALRLTLWRATGSTGAAFVPQIAARKRADCGL